ncbi:MAG: NAD(P)H-dependent glycerol-3-phosphate dehydrogenase [Tissierellia bacterium]|nr:NAD(P)H-dependent glycerol-3-phosphate dehydrogenase [Tissierellia bacterium]
MNDKIAVLGGGSWGTALAILLANKGFETDIWVRNEKQAEDMKTIRINKKYLPNVKFPDKLNVNTNLEETLYKKSIVLSAIPTHGIRETLENARPFIKDNQIIINVAKGIENNSLMRVSEIVNIMLPNNKYAILSGPSHAEEVAINMPTTVVSASSKKEVAEQVQDLFTTPSFRVYTNPDVIGVELGGALKNIIALGAGICDGLKYGDNTKAALMTRGIIEMERLGAKLGANPNTFTGLSGIGDLIVTCTSVHSRNRKCGILLGEGLSLDEAIKNVGMVVEGVKTTKSAYRMSKELGVEMPITEEIYNLLYNNVNIKESVSRLMGRNKKHEMEDIAITNNYNW